MLAQRIAYRDGDANLTGTLVTTSPSSLPRHGVLVVHGGAGKAAVFTGTGAPPLHLFTETFPPLIVTSTTSCYGRSRATAAARRCVSGCNDAVTDSDFDIQTSSGVGETPIVASV